MATQSQPDQPAKRQARSEVRTPAQVKPLDPPMTPIAVGGTVAWAVIGLALLPFRATLAAQGHEDWLWICLAGFLLGFPGLAVMLRHDATRRRRRAGPG